MSPSAYIVERQTRTGKRWHVRYRLHGHRGDTVLHAGAFRTAREAKLRRDFVAGELAAGRDPRDALAALGQAPPAPRTFQQDAAAWLEARIDVATRTRASNRSHVDALTHLIGDQPTETLTTSSLQTDAIAPLAARLKPSTLRLYVATLRMILDHAGADPNPARSVNLPRVTREDPVPPSAPEVLAILEHVHRPWLLPLLLMEQTAMRVGEVVNLTWGDVDETGGRLRVRAATAKTRRSRWVQTPAWLMAAIVQTCPPDDRTPARPVFSGNGNACKNAMLRACQRAGIAAYSPHDLRHRRLSLWHGQGIPARQLADRAGHTNPSMTLGVYSHVMPLDELDETQMRALVVAPW